MQKVLLASTALVMTTGWAMADVTNAGDGVGASITLEGFAAMGVVSTVVDTGDFDDPDFEDPNPFLESGDLDSNVSFATDLDIKFIMAGQTDGGLEFGAQIDLDESGNGELFEDPDKQSGEEIYIRGAFGALYMGDTDGAFDWALSEPAFGSSIGDIQEHAGWNGNSGLDGIYDGQIARYEYAFGDFGIAVSGEIDDDEDDEGAGDPALGLGAKYSTAFAGAEVTLGAGVQAVSGLEDVVSTAFEEDDDFAATVYGVSAALDFANGFKAIGTYSAANVDGFDSEDDSQYYGLALGYETGPLLVAANYGHFEDWVSEDDDGDLIAVDAEGFGLLANYDLGGGAQLQGAVSQNLVGDDDFTTYSFGVAMAF